MSDTFTPDRTSHADALRDLTLTQTEAIADLLGQNPFDLAQLITRKIQEDAHA